MRHLHRVKTCAMAPSCPAEHYQTRGDMASIITLPRSSKQRSGAVPPPTLSLAADIVAHRRPPAAAARAPRGGAAASGGGGRAAPPRVRYAPAAPPASRPPKLDLPTAHVAQRKVQQTAQDPRRAPATGQTLLSCYGAVTVQSKQKGTNTTRWTRCRPSHVAGLGSRAGGSAHQRRGCDGRTRRDFSPATAPRLCRDG